jgi:hypothetical protein
MYEGLISQLVPLTAKAAGAVDLLNKSDINWLDGTGSSKQYKAGGAQAVQSRWGTGSTASMFYNTSSTMFSCSTLTGATCVLVWSMPLIVAVRRGVHLACPLAAPKHTP